ncbi:MAG TPA: hypothetical protein VIS09_22730 [Streptomyces sp.]
MAIPRVFDGKRTAYGITHHTLSLTAPDGKGLAASASEKEEEGAEGRRK